MSYAMQNFNCISTIVQFMRPGGIDYGENAMVGENNNICPKQQSD